jgi:ABC-type phosphate transport system substrate-binding protein
MKSKLIAFGLLVALLCLGAGRARALDGAVVIANSSIATDSLTANTLKDIYTGKTKYWEGGQAIVIVVLPDQTDGALQQVCGMDTSSFKTFWQRLVFSGRGQLPKKADDVATLMAMVASTKGAIALVPANAELKGVKKLETK